MRNKDYKHPAIYQGPNGALELKTDSIKETIWASQAQIVQLYEVDQSVVSRHVHNIFKDSEIDKKSNMQKMHIPNSDKLVTYYSLDIILAVGYRTNSSRAVIFRKWATKTLREHIINGYTINKKRIVKNYDSFMQAVESVQNLLPEGSNLETENILELIKAFADTWFSLSAYDKQRFDTGKITKKKVEIAADELSAGISELKAQLIEKGEASSLFALERHSGALAGIVGNIMQTYNRKDLYNSTEEKAAHLLYFVVKTHPFVDGNKRSGAFAFVWFLRQAGILDIKRLNPQALTVLTLLIAESNPRDKDKMTGLVAMLLRK